METETEYSAENFDARLTALEAHPAIAGASTSKARSADQHRAVCAALTAQIGAIIRKRAQLERDSSSGSALQAGMAGGVEQQQHNALSDEIKHLQSELNDLDPAPAVRQTFTLGPHIGSTPGWQITNGRLTFHVTERPEAEAIVAALNRDAARMTESA